MPGLDSIRRRIMRNSVRRRTKAAYTAMPRLPVPRATYTLRPGFMGDVNEAVEHIRRALAQPIYTGPAPARTVQPIPQPMTYTRAIPDDAAPFHGPECCGPKP